MKPSLIIAGLGAIAGLLLVQTLAFAADKPDASDPKKQTRSERVIIINGSDGNLWAPDPPTAPDAPGVPGAPGAPGSPGAPPMPPMPPMGHFSHCDGDTNSHCTMIYRFGHSMGPGEMSVLGPKIIYGGPGSQKPATVDEVKTWLGKVLARDGNPRLRLGTVKDKDAKSIEAIIETVDGSLVQKLLIDKEFWIVRRVNP